MVRTSERMLLISWCHSSYLVSSAHSQKVAFITAVITNVLRVFAADLLENNAGLDAVSAALVTRMSRAPCGGVSRKEMSRLTNKSDKGDECVEEKASEDLLGILGAMKKSWIGVHVSEHRGFRALM